MITKTGVALIGTGFWGRRLAEAVKRTPTLELISCYSRNEEKRNAFAADFDCSAAASFEEAISYPKVHGVILATPNNVHAEQTAAIAALGKCVFVEKPIADTLEDARAMQRACEEAGVTLLVGHSFRRLGAARKVKQLIDEGAIGKPVLAEANFSLPGMLTPEKWRYYRETCPGGPLMQLGIHHADTLQYWLGPVVKVQGIFKRLHTDAEIDDLASAQLEFESGIVGTLNSSYVSPKTFDLRVYGTEGVVDYHTDMSIWPNAAKMDEATQLRMWTKNEQKEISFEPVDMLVEELDEFGRCISDAGRAETGPREAIQALQVILGAIESAESGRGAVITKG